MHTIMWIESIALNAGHRSRTIQTFPETEQIYHLVVCEQEVRQVSDITETA